MVVWWHHRVVLKEGGLGFTKFFSANFSVYFEAEKNIRNKQLWVRESPVLIHINKKSPGGGDLLY